MYTIQGTVVTHTEVEGTGETIAEAMKAWRANGGRGVPEWIHRGEEDDGEAIVAVCEGCGGPILEGQRYGTDPDGDYPAHVNESDCLAATEDQGGA